MDHDTLVSIVQTNPVNREILRRMPDAGLADAWLVSGSLFQTVWNHLTGRPPAHGIKDYDLFYFDDTDLTWEAEDRAIRRAERSFAGIAAPIEIRNQARVHLWYPEKFGTPYPPLASSTEGIDRFLGVVCMLGLRSDGRGGVEVYAPRGLADLEALIVRPNPSVCFTAENYRAKAGRWQASWPEIRVLDTV
ncbi:nucleotidyltransferase family protein [Acidimangrovimonas sediminis]|uniref:nucleotidyltransferase family protein n=1 Tax=Acidimangrovimonas sediminis TaxID=2056283 RepID=UPI001E5431A4|nr:nucleotidyltransferase family protein [Acidimangrovimonas sediminis]